MFARIGEAGGGAAGVAWYLTDHLGSVQSIVNNAGVVLDQRTYGAFGDITSETDPSFLDRYGYAGGQLDPVTGFVRFGKRLDNTAAGRFITPDPTGMSADSNYYRIDGNGPTYRTDPTGLAWGWGDYTLAAAGFVVLPLNVVNAAAAAHGESPTQGAVGFGKGLVEPFVAAGDAAQDVGHFLGVSGAPQYRSDTAKAVQRDLAVALQAGYSTPEAVGLTLVKGVSPIVYGTAAGPAASYAVNGAMTGNWNPVPTPEALGTTTTVIVVTAGVTKVVSLRGCRPERSWRKANQISSGRHGRWRVLLQSSQHCRPGLLRIRFRLRHVRGGCTLRLLRFHQVQGVISSSLAARLRRSSRLA